MKNDIVMASNNSEISIEIIDEIIEACADDAPTQTNRIEKSAGDDNAKGVDQSDARIIDHEEIGQTNGTNVAAADEVFGESGASEGNDCQTDRNSYDVRVVDADIVGGDMNVDGQRSDGPANGHNAGMGDLNEIGRTNSASSLAAEVELSDASKGQTNIPNYDVRFMGSVVSDDELLKSFSMKNLKGLSVVENVRLTAPGVNVPKYEIRCEGFPPGLAEEELILLFARLGEVYKLTRHWDTQLVYVAFTKAADAEKAIRTFHNRTFRRHQIRIHKQVTNRRLIMLNIPRAMGRNRLFEVLREITPNLVSVSVYNDPLNETMNRGFCYLEYPDYYEAAEAKRIWKSHQPFRNYTHVEWPERCFEWMEKPDMLFISNLRMTLGSRELIRISSAYGRVIDINRSSNISTIRFLKAEDAKCAANEIDMNLLGNENVEITSFRLMERHELERNVKTLRRSGIDDGENHKTSAVKVQPQPNVEPKLTNPSGKSPSDEVPPLQQSNVDPNVSDTLYINNLPPTTSAADLRKIFSLHDDDDVLYIELHRNAGTASVHFSDTARAKKAASSVDKRQLGIGVQISFFNDAADKVYEMLHITNLRSDIIPADLLQLFTVYSKLKEIDLDNDSATVHFHRPEDAKLAVRSVDRQCLGDHVQISFGDRMENKPENDRAGTSENRFEMKQADATANTTGIKRAETTANVTEKKRAETTEKPAQRKPVVTSNTLYIYGTFPNMTTRRLRQLFAVYGRVLDIDIDVDQCSASVVFGTKDEAIRAAHAVNRIHLSPGPVA